MYGRGACVHGIVCVCVCVCVCVIRVCMHVRVYACTRQEKNMEHIGM